jgi:hypothetical protein
MSRLDLSLLRGGQFRISLLLPQGSNPATVLGDRASELLFLVAGRDLNPRPLGYEPRRHCSTRPGTRWTQAARFTAAACVPVGRRRPATRTGAAR